MTTPPPAVGQIWQDNDPRGYGRRIRYRYLAEEQR